MGGNKNAPLAEASGRINKAASAYITPFAQNQAFWNIDPTQLATQGINFGLAQAPGINTANMQQLQYMLGTAIPGYGNIVNQMATNTQQLLAGQIPADVQSQIQRSAAFTSLMSGAGGGAGTAGTAGLTARDLGLTSLQLQQQGFGQGQNLLNLGRTALMPQPVNPLSLLPLSDLINAVEWSKSAYFQANEAAFNARSAAASAGAGLPASNPLGDIGGILGSLTGQLGQKNPNTGQTGFESLASLFGGGGGGTTSFPGGGGISSIGGNPIGSFAGDLSLAGV
jgi:hypothetical protein